MAEIITLFVCKKFQTTIFFQIKSREIKWWRHFPVRSSSSLSILHHQCGHMADRKPNPCIVKWILFTWYLNSPPFGLTPPCVAELSPLPPSATQAFVCYANARISVQLANTNRIYKTPRYKALLICFLSSYNPLLCLRTSYRRVLWKPGFRVLYLPLDAITLGKH